MRSNTEIVVRSEERRERWREVTQQQVRKTDLATSCSIGQFP